MQQGIARVAAAFLGLFFCGWLTLDAARIGISRFLSDYGLKADLLVAAERALSFSASDPEIRVAISALFAETGEFAASARALEQGTLLRPRDYRLWLELGIARDQAGEREGAIAAFREAARLAPYYAQPRWQLGNALLRAERNDEAFVELRRAAASAPALLPNLIDLAYGLYGNASTVERVVQPQSRSAQLMLARFWAKNGKAEDCLRLLRTAGQLSAKERQDLVTDLVTSRQFTAAYEVWASGAENGHRTNALVDGGFEDAIRMGAPLGFGWRIERYQRAVSVSLNTRQPHSGTRSLLLEWNGDPQAGTAAVSQLIVVEPQKHYRLSFWARAEKLVTGGAPIITVSAPGTVERLLGQSAPLLQATQEWRQFSLEFQTNAQTQAVTIAVRRDGCTGSPCPIFGQIWLDDLVLSHFR